MRVEPGDEYLKGVVRPWGYIASQQKNNKLLEKYKTKERNFELPDMGKLWEGRYMKKLMVLKGEFQQNLLCRHLVPYLG